MARRALLERSAEFTAEDEVPPARQPHPVRLDQAPSHWRGAGGRWLIWVGRVVAWAVLLLIGYRGVLSIIQGPTPRTPAGSASLARNGQFPVTAAEAYALEFGHVYLSFSPATAAIRSRDLARFLPPGTDPHFGLTGTGAQRVLDEQIAAISVSGRHNAIVTLLAQLGGGRLIELGVPVYVTTGGGMSVSGYPALLPGPAKAVPPPAAGQATDQATETALQAQLPAFFQAYASGDQETLARFTAPGAHVTGLDHYVSFGGIDSIDVPAGGSTRQISVTVTWQLPPATAAAKPATPGAAPAAVQMTYQMTVIRQHGSWDVRAIGASTVPLAQGPP